MKSEHQSRYLVWARALWAYLDLAKLARVDVRSAFEGMPFDARTVRSRSNIEWDHFCQVTERLEALCGGPERCQELLDCSYHQVLPEFHWLAGDAMCPVSFAKLSLEVISPIVYQGCAFSVTEAGPHRLLVQLRLREGARPSTTFFRATVGELRALPRHLGLPPATVTAELSATRGDYDMLLPARPGALARALEGPAALAGVGAQRGDGGSASWPDTSARAGIDLRMRAAQAMWRLTARQVEVLRHVAEGASNKEIAERLGCAENTVELHVTKLLQKAQLPSRARLIAQLWGGP